MTTALVPLPLVKELQPSPEGFSRREWTRGADHYCFVVARFGRFQRIFKVDGPPHLDQWPADGDLQIQVPVATAQ